MRFNSHSDHVGRHAFLSPSNYHWVNYSDDKLERVFTAAQAAKRGDDMHDLAQRLIRLGQKLPRARKTLNLYVNDAIGFRMSPEVPLVGTDFWFGTADAIGFRNRKLRVHDLKTGVTPVKITQCEVYAALFCYEYGVSPLEIEIELRMYQNDEVKIYEGDPVTIINIIEKGKAFSKRIEEMMKEDLL